MNFVSSIETPRCSIRSMDALKFLRTLGGQSVDLLFTSPPYFIGKSYDVSKSLRDFRTEISRIILEIERVMKPTGSVCWQVGNHIIDGEVTPLDAEIIPLMREIDNAKLRNRVVWTFDHGVHAQVRLSGRHETILWYSMGDDYHFDVDKIRVPQKYPGKRHYKGPKKGLFSGNPKGKNPGDVWSIPNVKANHVEKTIHPCQFPISLVERFVKLLTPINGLVIDPYLGSGSTALAAIKLNRHFLGCDISKEYTKLARSRVRKLRNNALKIREDIPVMRPDPNSGVAKIPEHFWKFAGE